MAQSNEKRTKTPTKKTYEGAAAQRSTPLQTLQRVLNAHLLWEDTFYIDGKSSAEVLKLAVRDAVKYDDLATQATIMEARTEMNIRHASLLAAIEFAKCCDCKEAPEMRANMIFGVIQRADELAEVLAMSGGKAKPRAVKRGVQCAFSKFDEYQFAKYKGGGRSVTLRDAVFLSHPDPKRVPLVQKIVDQTLEVPNTWEARLSSGEDKKAVFEDLLETNKLGAMALLRNLRNMDAAGVSTELMEQAFDRANWSRVLPFRFLSAAKYAPHRARLLDAAFRKAVEGSTFLPGRTAVLVDTSASMDSTISNKSTVRRVEAGAAIAAAINGDTVHLYEWADRTKPVANFCGLSAALSIRSGAVGHGTHPGQAIEFARKQGHGYERYIIVSDMQFADSSAAVSRYSYSPKTPSLQKGEIGYSINVAAYENAGILHGDWTHINGFSAAVLKYIAAAEMDRV